MAAATHDEIMIGGQHVRASLTEAKKSAERVTSLPVSENLLLVSFLRLATHCV